MRTWIKIGVASLAFVPMVLYFLSAALTNAGFLPENIGHYVLIGCAVCDFPAFLIIAGFQNVHLIKHHEILYLLGFMLVWSSLVAYFFWQMAREFLGENEPEYETNPEHAKYDWVGFRVRFVCGFVIGFLGGWRVVRYSTSVPVLLTAMTVVGLLVGLGFGLYRPNFWSRP
jgi:hypothetical protein